VRPDAYSGEPFECRPDVRLEDVEIDDERRSVEVVDAHAGMVAYARLATRQHGRDNRRDAHLAG
jgi:hypothetical protein